MTFLNQNKLDLTLKLSDVRSNLHYPIKEFKNGAINLSLYKLR